MFNRTKYIFNFFRQPMLKTDWVFSTFPIRFKSALAGDIVPVFPIIGRSTNLKFSKLKDKYRTHQIAFDRCLNVTLESGLKKYVCGL